MTLEEQCSRYAEEYSAVAAKKMVYEVRRKQALDQDREIAAQKIALEVPHELVLNTVHLNYTGVVIPCTS
jgi:hypothetical protein